MKTVNPSLSIHDLRVVPGILHTNLVFDCLANFDVNMSDYELKWTISNAVKSVRLILEFIVWNEEHNSFFERFERYISTCAKYGISCMIVLQMTVCDLNN